jgi:hypothetical protein
MAKAFHPHGFYPPDIIPHAPLILHPVDLAACSADCRINDPASENIA